MKMRGPLGALLIGCGLLVLLAVLAIGAVFALLAPVGVPVTGQDQPTADTAQPVSDERVSTQAAVATFTPAVVPVAQVTQDAPDLAQAAPELVTLYQQVSPGVVNIKVFSRQAGGQGAGSGFVLDEQGHIITNHHVVVDADAVTVVFFNGVEVAADVVGSDADSDIAVLQVEGLPEGAVPLALGDSDDAQVGEWVVAIGNPFGLGTSMSIGIISATGRVIASGFTPFAIPEAIQTDAAINPGNSGGPLLNLAGEVIGVNAQIATSGVAASSGVGFAIPVNVVRRIAPVVIEQGDYAWPWLGVEGDDVNLLLARANNLETQDGAYLHNIVPGGPADEARLRGSQGTTVVDSAEVFVGGDVVIAMDGEPVADFTALLSAIAEHNPGDSIALTILREGERQDVTVTLAARPSSAGVP